MAKQIGGPSLATCQLRAAYWADRVREKGGVPGEFNRAVREIDDDLGCLPTDQPYQSVGDFLREWFPEAFEEG